MTLVEEIAWSAGLFDGEGCVIVQKKKRKGLPPRYYIKAQVIMTHELTILRLQELWGGSVCYTDMGKYDGGRGWKGHWAWAVSCATAEAFFRAVLPYLVTKNAQAKLALEFRALIGPSGRRLSPEAIEAREAIYQEMKRLNRKGLEKKR